jgi:hypothetical protein
MRREPLCLLQVGLVGLSTTVALASFLSSSLFASFSSYSYHLLQGNAIYESIPFGRTFLVELAVTVFFIAVVMVDLRHENFGYILVYNLILLAPEVLSNSQVNYLNLLDLSKLFTPNRSQEVVIVTGLIIVLSFCMIEFVSREREIIRSYGTRGVSNEAMHLLEISSIRYTVMVGGSTFIVAVILLAANLVLDYPRSWFIMPYQQLVLGVASLIFLLMGILLYMNYFPHSSE